MCSSTERGEGPLLICRRYYRPRKCKIHKVTQQGRKLKSWVSGPKESDSNMTQQLLMIFQREAIAGVVLSHCPGT